MVMPVPPGLSATSDNAALLQAAMADGGFALPAGTFPVSRALVPPAGCTVEGSGSYCSVLKVTAAGQSAISMTDCSHFTARGVGLTGPGVTAGTAPGIAIARSRAPNTFGLLLDDVVIQHFGGDGISALKANVIVSAFRRVTCENVTGCGFSLTGVPSGAAGTSTSLTACFAVACGKSAYHLQKMNYSSFSACAADACGTGYILEECQGISFAACGAEGIAATGATMYTDGTSFRADRCDGVDFGTACWTYGNTGLVLRVSGASRNIRGRIAENTPAVSAVGAVLVDSGSEYGG
jgi:hypothetical protein